MIVMIADDIYIYNTVVVYREIVTMPFGPNETRLPEEVANFVVSTLAVVLQMHWFSHCTSCFKNSRCTTGAHVCRYLFPRDRSPSSSIDTSAIQLVRLLGHEYINGFSDILLRAFKCNHDIQVLLDVVFIS